jgi:hypothetical protein
MAPQLDPKKLYKMESIFKMVILRLSTRPFEPCIFAILKPTIFKFWILIEDYIRTKRAAVPLSRSFEIERGLGPSEIKVFSLYFITF